MLRINGKDVAVGMTTCPRSESYIQESINSLIDNGWGVPLVYSDDDMRGDFWGFLQVLKLLVNAYPRADCYLILQDDVVACMGPEEAGKYFCESFSLISLFTMHPNIQKATNRKFFSGYNSYFNEIRISTPRERANNCNGGIAYFVNPNFARILLEEPVTCYTPTPSMLGEICSKNRDYGHYLVSPVNVFEHIGVKSSLHPDKPHYKWDVTNAAAYRK